MKNLLSVVLIPTFLLLAFVASAQEYGIASYYSDDFQGRKTAYGDIYDKNKLTAAHKKHPYGTKLRITRLDNKKTVDVTVNDKGPYIKGRVVDLSRAAAERLGVVADGVAEVKVEVVGKASTSDLASNVPKDRPDTYEDEPTTKPSTDDEDKEKSSSSSSSSSSTASKSSSSSKTTTSSSTKKSSERSAKLVGKDYTTFGLYKIVLERPTEKGFAVQVASLSNYENVMRQVADLQAKWFDNILISVERGDGDDPIYKVLLGPFNEDDKAQNYRSSLEKKHKIKGFVVNLNDISY